MIFDTFSGWGKKCNLGEDFYRFSWFLGAHGFPEGLHFRQEMHFWGVRIWMIFRSNYPSMLGGAGGTGWASGEGDSYIKLVLEDDD